MSDALSILVTRPYGPDRLLSIDRFVRCLTDSLAPEVAIRAVGPVSALGRFAFTRATAKWLGYFDKYVLFPRRLQNELRRDPAAVLHFSDQGDAFYASRFSHLRSLLTCHDVLAIRAALGEIPEKKVRASGRLQQKRIRAGLRRFGRIVCVSKTTQSDLARITSRPPQEITVIPMGIDPRFRPMERDRAQAIVSQFIPRNPFILHVGGNQWYKNRLGALRIFLDARPKLPAGTRMVMIGKPPPPEIEHFIRQEGLTDAVPCLSHCTDEDLRAFYSAANLLLFPSFYEGFGWPVLEAQACGCAVVTTDRAPMNEIGGSAAAYLQPENTTASSAIVCQVFHESPKARTCRVLEGFENVRRFSVQRMAKDYLSIYRELAASAA